MDNPYDIVNLENSNSGTRVTFKYMQNVVPFNSDSDDDDEYNGYGQFDDDEYDDDDERAGSHTKKSAEIEINKRKDNEKSSDDETPTSHSWVEHYDIFENKRRFGEEGESEQEHERGRDREIAHESPMEENRDPLIVPTIRPIDGKTRNNVKEYDLHDHHESYERLGKDETARRRTSNHRTKKESTFQRNGRRRREPPYDDTRQRFSRSTTQQRQQEMETRGRMRRNDKRPSCCGGRGSSKILATLIGLFIVGVWLWATVLSSYYPTKKIFHSYRFTIQDEGVPPGKSMNITENELKRRLIDDIPMTRLAIDLTEYIKENPWRTCMCMHHLLFLPGKNALDIAPRKFCVLYNEKRGESEVMINPVVVGRSHDTNEFIQKSRGCKKEHLPVRMQRPQILWVEWGDMLLNYAKPEGKRIRKNYAKFTGKEAACLALILEELEGKMTCGGNVAKIPSSQKGNIRKIPPKLNRSRSHLTAQKKQKISSQNNSKRNQLIKIQMTDDDDDNET